MINVIQNNDSYEISFPYDPNVVYIVKNIPGRRWNPSQKIWTIPKENLGFLLNQVKGTVYERAVQVSSMEDLNINSTLDATASIPEIDISKIPFYVKDGFKPYQHQLDFMKYALNRQLHGNMGGFILADDQGLAKSCEAINLALYDKKQYKFKHCLIICCINSSKYNWMKEVYEHTNHSETPYLLGARLRRDGSERGDTGSAEKLQDLISLKKYGSTSEDIPYFMILNIEAIRYRVERKYPIADRIIELINSGQLNMIVIDEIHKNTSPTSVQGKQILRIKQATGTKAAWFPLSGTPITKNPTDVFLPLRLVNGHNYKSFYMWAKEYCMYGGYNDYEIIGYKNIPSLKKSLQDNMLRRLKSDVLDLPPKIRYTEYVENTPYQSQLYTKVANDIRAERDEILSSLNPLAKFLRLRQVNGNPELVDTSLNITDSGYLKKNAKLQRLLELLQEIHERGEKVVVFSNWVECLRTLYKFVASQYKTCCFTGTMKSEVREQHKRVFQENPNYTVMLGTIGALGTTHTLTAARNVIFYDRPWNPSDMEQAEDRIYRIGTTSSVNIYTLVSKDTIDERVEEILSRKGDIQKYIVDNKLDIRHNPELFDMLIGRG